MIRRVALISEHASPLAPLGSVDSGGQNIYVGQIAKNLVSQGYKVDIFTRRDNAFSPFIVDYGGARVIHVPAGPPRFVCKEELLPYMDEFARQIVTFIQRNGKYDLMHANFWMSGLSAVHIRRQTGVPFVITFHALGRIRLQYQKENDRFPRERLEFEDRIVEAADGIVAECPQERDDLLALYHARPEKIEVVPCGFDPREIWPVPRRMARTVLGLAAKNIVLAVSRMVPRKGLDTAVRAFARVVRGGLDNTKMLILGGNSPEPDAALTPEIGRLREIAAQEGIGDRVVFKGQVGREDLKYYYSASDLFVTTPWYEPFGITPLEAMACGVPVIGSRTGGIKYSIRDGLTGFLVPPQDVGGTAEKLSLVLGSEELRRSMGRSALKHVHRNFDWSHVASLLVDFYERTLRKAQVPQPNAL